MNFNTPRILILSVFTISLMSCGLSQQSITNVGPSNPTVDNGNGDSDAPIDGPGLACVKASLSWTPPQTRADGTAITSADLGGYKIFMGQESQNYSDMFVLVDGAATSYAIHGLTQNKTYFFAIKAYDINGIESPSSEEVSWVARKCE